MRRWIGFVFIGWASTCHAQGVFSVPSGDTLRAGVLSNDFELDSGPQLRSPATLAILSSRFGLTDRLTVGEDFLMSGTTQGQPNFSYGIFRNRSVSIAGGYENVGVRSFGEQPYVTATLSQGNARGHVGWTRSNHDSLMLGAEYALSPRLSIQADTITGRDNFTTTGLQYSLNGHISVSGGFMHANLPPAGNGIFFDLNWTLTINHGTH